MTETITQKRRMYVYEKFGDATRGVHTSMAQKKKLLKRFWSEAKRMYK